MSGSGDAKRAANFIAHVGLDLPNAVDSSLATWAAIGLARLKLAASGRPGPRRVTGDYTRSMNMQVARSAGGVSASIGTNAAQALRLEYGFVGSDSLGRRYNQQALPHFAPTFEWLASAVQASMPGVVQRVM
jgi:hypothetical protein